MADFLETLDHVISRTYSIIEEFENQLESIRKHHDRVRIAKTVGTTVSTTGAVIMVGSLILAPFTGGASIVAATGYGAAVNIAGAATNLATDVTDMIKTKLTSDQVEHLCDYQRKSVSRLIKYFDEIERVASIMKVKIPNALEAELYAKATEVVKICKQFHFRFSHKQFLF